MNKVKRNSILVLVFAFALVPALSWAQSQQGFTNIVSCGTQQGASLPSSVGAFAATGGVYVPVADATVELNTGTLVYKECVLRVLVDAEKQAMTAGLAQNATNNVLTGRGGSAQFAQMLSQATDAIQSNAVANVVQNYTSSLDPNIASQVKTAVLKGEALALSNAPSMLTCQYQGATADLTSSNPQGNVWSDILAIASPCDPLLAYEEANDLALGSADQEVSCQEEQWQWGGGFYSVTTGSGGPCEQQIQTPSSYVNGLYLPIAQTGYTQLQNANDIGQLVQPLFAGISSQVLAGTYGGVAGLTSQIGSSPSYLQQAVSQESGNFQSVVSGLLTQSILNAIQSENSYLTVIQKIQTDLTSAQTELQQQQNSCWQTVAQAVCGSGFTLSTSNASCTGQNGTQYTFATSSDNFAAVAIAASQVPTDLTNANTLASSTANVLAQLQTLLQQSQSGGSTSNSAFSSISGQIANSTQISSMNTVEQNVETYLGTPGASSGFVATTISGWQGQTTNTDSNGNPVIVSWAGTLPPNGTDTGWCNATASTTSEWESKL